MSRKSKTSIPLKRDAFVMAWRQFAAEVSFAGMSLEEFRYATEKSVTDRNQIEALKVKLAGLIRQRGVSDEALRKNLILVINAVRGAPAYGEDSPLYRALGYVPRSERLSGLTRKSPAPATEAASANAA